MANAFGYNDNIKISTHLVNIDEYKSALINSIATFQSLPDFQTINDIEKIAQQINLSNLCQSIEQQYQAILKQTQQLKHQYNDIINKINDKMDTAISTVSVAQICDTEETQNESTKQQQQKPLIPIEPHNQITSNIGDDSILHCNGRAEECDYLKQLKQQIAEQEGYDGDITCILNNFLHLIEAHDRFDEAMINNDFEYIYHELGGFCDIETCESFERNHRDKMKYKDVVSLTQLYKIPKYDKKQISYLQIMDKIHCFYRHGFDIGCRLNKEEIAQIISYNNNDTKTDDDDVMTPNLNKMQIYQIVKNKHRPRLNQETNRYCFDIETKTKGFTAMYSFGQEFDYEIYEKKHNSTIYSLKKHDSFKQELISNHLAPITIQQFDNELEKAMVHYHSFHCRMIIKEHEDRVKHRADELHGRRMELEREIRRYMLDRIKELKAHHILSLMVYCNFDNFQHELSKTYRKIDCNESDAHLMKRHSTFYYISKYLKQVVSSFGVTAKKDQPIPLYHGIDKPLGFTKIHNCHWGSPKCPLSATTSFSVAANFATNSGMVMEFMVIVYGRTYIPSYFPVSWLSDFGNEAEQLFVQCQSELHIQNIVLLKTGCELKHILRSVELLGAFDSGRMCNYTESQYLLTNKLIHNELHCSNPDKYEKFQSLHPYAAELMHTFCQNKNKFSINRECIRKEFCRKEFCRKEFCNLFCVKICETMGWINLGVIGALFPNLKVINVIFYFKSIPDKIMEDILEYVRSAKKIKEIYLRLDDGNCDVSQLTQKFGNKLYREGFSIKIEIYIEGAKQGEPFRVTIAKRMK